MGVLAGWLQIYRGTKYSRFPRFLDSWLRMRKQLGLLMMFAASIHACLSVAYMSPRYQDIVYGQDGLEGRVLPYGWSLWIRLGLSFGNQLTTFCHRYTQLEGVCLCSEWVGMDSDAGSLRPRHVLRVAVHQLAKLPHSFLLPVCPLRARPDHPAEVAARLASYFYASGQDQSGLCTRHSNSLREPNCVKKKRRGEKKMQ